jgi:hypothetical protein
MSSGRRGRPSLDAIDYSGPWEGPAPPAMSSGEHCSPSLDAIDYSGPWEGPAPPAMSSGEHCSPSLDAIDYSGPWEGPAPPAMSSGEHCSPSLDAMVRHPHPGDGRRSMMSARTRSISCRDRATASMGDTGITRWASTGPASDFRSSGST